MNVLLTGNKETFNLRMAGFVVLSSLFVSLVIIHVYLLKNIIPDTLTFCK